MLESIFVSPGYWIMGSLTFLVLAFVAMSLYFWIRAVKKYHDEVWESGWSISSIMGGIIFLIMGGFFFGGVLPPYDTSFYQTYRITGELTEIESAFEGDEGTMSQVFIAAVDGIDYYIKSDDQRFRTFEVGDSVNLICYKNFQYFQEPTFSCDVGAIVRS